MKDFNSEQSGSFLKSSNNQTPVIAKEISNETNKIIKVKINFFILTFILLKSKKQSICVPLSNQVDSQLSDFHVFFMLFPL
jgi:hypothetical protein